MPQGGSRSAVFPGYDGSNCIIPQWDVNFSTLTHNEFFKILRRNVKGASDARV